ncbi:MAG: hypothetical protein AAGE01_10135 [Pseudomonadota bacterium]
MARVLSIVPRLLLAGLGAAPLIALTIVLLATWQDPSRFGERWLRAASTLVLLEILLLHSGAFMATGPIILDRLWQRLGWFLGFGAFYAMAIGVYVRWVDSAYVLGVVLGVVAMRLVSQTLLRDRRGTILALQRSAIGIVVMLATALLCVMPVPPFGVDEAARAAAFGGRDDYIATHPQRFLLWGAGYFLLMGVVEALIGWNLLDWTDEQVDQAWRDLGR